MPRKEKHWGTVADNQDPEKRGRLTVEVPTIAEGEVLDWIEPSFHFVDSSAEAGCFWVPNVGSTVEVEIEAEEDSEVTDLEAKWMCSVYPDGTVPSEFEQNYPERRGWKTKAGHLLYFDDTDGELTFLYHHPSGTEIVITNSGEIQLTPASGESVLIGSGATEHIPHGDILEAFLTSLKSWADAHTHAVSGTAAAGVPPADHTHVVTGTAVAPSDSPVIPTDLLSDYHKVQ